MLSSSVPNAAWKNRRMRPAAASRAIAVIRAFSSGVMFVSVTSSV